MKSLIARFWIHALVILSLVAACVGAAHWWTGRPTEANIERVARRIVQDRLFGTTQVDRLRTPAGALCLSIPQSPAPDRTRTDWRSGGWFMDFYPQSSSKKGREEQLRKLDALAAAGLLDRSEMTLTDRDIEQPVIRYIKSDLGISVSSGGNDELGSCFVYGVPEFLSIKEFKPMKLGGVLEGSEVYEVTVRLGFPQGRRPASWVEHPQLLKEFPEIAKNIGNGEMKLAVARVSGRLENFDRAFGAMMGREQEGLTAAHLRAVSFSESVNFYWESSLYKLKTIASKLWWSEPTEEEIIGLLKASEFMHGSNCLRLVDGNKLTADKVIEKSSYSRFVLDLERSRQKYDLVGEYTIPYVLALEKLGVYKRDGTEAIEAKGRLPASEGVVFQLDRRFGRDLKSTCLSLYNAKVEILDFEMKSGGLLTSSGTRFRYKAKVIPTETPEWAKDPVLLANWTELQYALSRGHLCFGEFGFDREERRLSDGSGTCFENYPQRYKLDPVINKES